MNWCWKKQIKSFHNGENFQKNVKIGNWESDKVAFYLPYLEGDKETILRDAEDSLEKLNLNFETIFANTNTNIWKQIQVRHMEMQTSRAGMLISS